MQVILRKILLPILLAAFAFATPAMGQEYRYVYKGLADLSNVDPAVRNHFGFPRSTRFSIEMHIRQLSDTNPSPQIGSYVVDAGKLTIDGVTDTSIRSPLGYWTVSVNDEAAGSPNPDFVYLNTSTAVISGGSNFNGLITFYPRIALDNQALPSDALPPGKGFMQYVLGERLYFRATVPGLGTQTYNAPITRSQLVIAYTP